MGTLRRAWETKDPLQGEINGAVWVGNHSRGLNLALVAIQLGVVANRRGGDPRLHRRPNNLNITPVSSVSDVENEGIQFECVPSQPRRKGAARASP